VNEFRPSWVRVRNYPVANYPEIAPQPEASAIGFFYSQPALPSVIGYQCLMSYCLLVTDYFFKGRNVT
jgi:hypothetical protein